MRHILLSIFLFLCATSMAQDIELRDLKLVNATSANASMRKDINGKTGCLLRLQMKEEGAQFEGNILGDVEYKNGEYNIYMAQGSRRLSIKHANYLPITVVFSTLGTKSLNEGSEYLMTTKLHKEKQTKDSKKRGVAVFNVSPPEAILSIDGREESIDVAGSYTLSLPYGTHYYSIRYNNFTINHQAVRVDKEPKQVDVDLSEFCPWLNVDCKDEAVEIYINDELKGEGKWKGLLPPGDYTIQARKEGCRTQSQSVTLHENESFHASFGEMKLIAGGLRVDYEPIGAEVYLDGQKIGVTPLNLNTILPGKHKLRITKEYCSEEKKDIIISEDQTLNMKGSLPMSFWAVLLNEAEKGDACAMFELAYYYTYRDAYWDEGNCGECTRDFEKKAKQGFIGIDNQDDPELNEPNYEKGLYWFKKAYKSKPAKHNHTHDDHYHEFNNLLFSLCYAMQGDYAQSFEQANKCYSTYNYGKWILAWHYFFGKGVEMDKRKAELLHPNIGTQWREYNGSQKDFLLEIW